MQLYEILLQTADKALEIQRKDGSMPAGSNGPHNHHSTPVRNTCHWLITFLKVYKITNDKKFLEAAEKCVVYLLEEKKKYKYNYPQRNLKGRDRCNGIIGPAWVIESLIIASREMRREDLSDLAYTILLMHEFDEEKGLWYGREIDGSIITNWTFNQQLWLTAVASMFSKKSYPEAHKRVNIFVSKIDDKIALYKNGLIWQAVALVPWNLFGLKALLLGIRTKTTKRREEIRKAIGYHQFNLYGFGILKENYPDFSFWNSEKFRKVLEYSESKKYREGLENNEYGFGYNVAGIEMAYVLSVFKKESEDLQRTWLEEQFLRNYDFKKRLLCKNTKDPETLSARIYEATRLRNINIKI